MKNLKAANIFMIIIMLCMVPAVLVGCGGGEGSGNSSADDTGSGVEYSVGDGGEYGEGSGTEAGAGNDGSQDFGIGDGSGGTGTAAANIMEYQEAEDRSEIEVFPDFIAFDLNGNTVTEEIFADADITVVNIWATFCFPCINEMPDLAKWDEEMPDNVQIIGIVADIRGEADSSAIADAVDIAGKAGVEFTNLIPGADLSGLLYSLAGYPTTYFVDSDGDIVDLPILGASVSTYKYIVEQYLAGAYDEKGNLIADAD